jgi:hypothetical protein
MVDVVAIVVSAVHVPLDEAERACVARKEVCVSYLYAYVNAREFCLIDGVGKGVDVTNF